MALVDKAHCRETRGLHDSSNEMMTAIKLLAREGDAHGEAKGADEFEGEESRPDK